MTLVSFSSERVEHTTAQVKRNRKRKRLCCQLKDGIRLFIAFSSEHKAHFYGDTKRDTSGPIYTEKPNTETAAAATTFIAAVAGSE